MARVFIDGFEDGTGNLWTPSPDVSYSASIPGYFASTNWRSCYINLPEAQTYYIAFKGSFHSAPSFDSDIAEHGITIRTSNGTILAKLVTEWVSASGICKLCAYYGTTLLGYYTLQGNEFNAWAHFQVAYKASTSADGFFRVKVNGIEVLTFTDCVTAPVSGLIGRLYLIPNAYKQYDDIVVDDSEWPGSTRIQTIRPNAAGSLSEFVPSTNGATNYTLVDEIPPSLTDFVYTYDAEATDLYGMTDFVPPNVAVPWNIKSVQVQVRGSWEGVSAAEKIKPVVLVDGDATVYPTTNVTGTDVLQLSTIPSTVAKIFEHNPSTGNAWTVAEINAMQTGFTSKA